MLHERSHGNGWRRVLVACVIGLSLCGVRASAQVTWDANTSSSGPQDGSGTWSTSDANWWNGTTDVVWPNLTTSNAIIGANSGAAGTITTSGSLTLNAITFNAPGSGNYTLTGGTLGFAGTSPTITANANATIGSAITSSGLQKNGTGTLTLSGIVSDAGTMKINSGAVTLTGTLTNSSIDIGSGSGGMLTIAGGTMSTSFASPRTLRIAPGSGQSGTMAISSGGLSTPGMYIGEDGGGNGAFTQSGGSVAIGISGLFLAGNTSSLTVSGGSFTNNNTTYLAVGNPNRSTSTISVSGSGAITLGTLRWGDFSRNGFTATLNVGDGAGGGTFQVNSITSGATSVASTINFNSGTFVANNTFTMPSLISTVVKAGGANISVTSGRTLTLGNPLTDDGGGGVLRKLGSGTLALTGANTYTGTTSIAAGSLSIGNALALQNSTLDLDASDTGTVSAISQNSTFGGLSGSRNLDMLTRTLSIGNNAASTTYSGTLSNGSLTKIGSGTFTLTGANAYTGATIIDAGVLQIGNGGTNGSLSTSSAISGSAGAGLVFSRTDNYGGNVSNNIGGGISLTLNSGTLALTGSNAYAGTTRLNGGALSLGAANALAGAGNVTFAGGTVQFTASNSGDFASRIKDSGSAIAIDTNSQNPTFAGSIDSSNTAGLVKSGGGTLVLSGSNAFSGGVTLTGGQVQIANANALGTGTFTTNVDVDTTIPFNLPTGGTVANAITISKPGSNRTYTFQQNQANNVTLAGNIAIASGNFNRFFLNSGVSSGTFTLTGSNTFGGDVISNANVTFRIGGTNAAGSAVWRPDVTAKMVLLDGANFRSVMGNAIASYSMEASGTATVSGDVFNRNTANVAVNLPAGAQLTFSGAVRAEGGSTTGTFTKTGAGTWVVNNTVNQMTYNVLEGTMQVPQFSGIGPTSTASFLVLNGGTLRYTGAAASTTREFTLGANGGGLDASGSGSAAFTSTAAVSFTGSGNRTLTLTGTNTGNNSLAMAISDNGSDKVSLSKAGAGTWVLSGSNAFTGNTRIGAGTLSLGNVNALAGSMLDMDAGDAGTLAFGVAGTNTYNIGGLMGARNIETTAAVVLSVGGNAASGTYAGIISGAGAFSKVGAGVLTLAGANTYSGATNVSAGTLAVNGSLANSSLTVASGATLMGSGTIAGLTTIAGLHRPGNSPGVETFTNLTYNSGASVQWELWGNTATNSPLVYDQIVVNGDLAFAGGTTLDLVFTGSAGPSSFSSVAWADPFWGTSQEWLLYDVANGTTGFAGNLTLATTNWQDSTGAFFQTVRPDSTFSLEQRGSDVYIVYAAVPEPTAIALAGIGTVLVAYTVLRRGRQRSVTKAG